MKLSEVIDMFGLFGFEAEEVRWIVGGAGQGPDNAHNAFEGLKLRLELVWMEWLEREEVGLMLIDRREELAQAHRTLQGLRLKSVKRVSDDDVIDIVRQCGEQMADRLAALGLNYEDVKEHLSHIYKRMAQGERLW